MIPRPPWMPSGNEVVKQLVIAAILAGAAWWIHKKLKPRDNGTAAQS